MQTQAISQPTDNPPQQIIRLHYLDWLRVIAIFGVFLFHATHPFTEGDWHIKNAELSLTLTVSIFLFYPWGMPFFFLIAGTGSWFALRRRTPRQYLNERFQRLLIPYIFGSILLTPIQIYFEWRHQVQTGMMGVSFLQFIADRWGGLNPGLFDDYGYHLWFLGFLFSFSLLALPIFLWLKGETGNKMILRLARLCEHRGGILLFAIPLMAVQLVFRSLNPYFPDEHGWTDFIFMLSFFILGYVIYADERFTRAIRRDWWLILTTGIVTLVALATIFMLGDAETWATTPTIPEFYLLWGVWSITSWCWTVFVLFIGMRFLDFSNAWLRYSQEAVLPFFVIHQPVIILIAFFIVQWNTGIPIKLLVVVLGSFVISLALYELVIRRIAPLRVIFGMTTRRLDKA